MSIRAGIVVTGTEVITARTVDRNGPWVSEQLAELGVEVAHLDCVGDRPSDLAALLAFLGAEEMDLIVTTGGLGPTADDLTTQIVADFCGREMVLDSTMEEKITQIVAGFAKRMKFDPEAMRAGTRKQAMLPAGAVPLDPAGTAPGVVVPAAGANPVVIVLPGPPRELQTMWPEAIATEPVRGVIDRADALRSAAMKMFGVPESTLAKSLREIEEGADISSLEITTCLRRGAELEIDVRFKAGEEAAQEALFEGLRQRHRPYIYTEAGESIDQLVAELLADRTIACAESCTGGLLAGRLTETPGASAYFSGGLVAYSNQAKQELLGVPGELIEGHGAVSVEVAEAMAIGSISRFDADFGVGITGVAGPDGGTEQKPVGYVCICVADREGNRVVRDPKLPGGRNDVRDRSVSVALHMIRRFLIGKELPL